MTKGNGKQFHVYMIDWFEKTTYLNLKFIKKHVAKPDGNVKKCKNSKKTVST